LRGCGGTGGSPHLAKRFTTPGVTGWLGIRQEGTESPMEKGQVVRYRFPSPPPRQTPT